MDDYCSQVCLSILVFYEVHLDIEYLIFIVKLFSEYLKDFKLHGTLFCVVVSRSLSGILYLWFMVLAKK